LINKGSASASEILAGALRDNGRADLLGEKTFGKGTIQQPVDVNGGGSVHISVAKWLTPNGIWVNENEGLDPDILVEYDASASAELEKDELDNQIIRAVSELAR
jgi:carboxyl-terminal processing protease